MSLRTTPTNTVRTPPATSGKQFAQFKRHREAGSREQTPLVLAHALHRVPLFERLAVEDVQIGSIGYLMIRSVLS